MNIEITQEMKDTIVKQSAEILARKLQGQINLKGLSDKIKQDVTALVISKAAGEFHKKINTERIVEDAVKGIEDRINARIAKLMARGITIRLEEGE